MTTFPTVLLLLLLFLLLRLTQWALRISRLRRTTSMNINPALCHPWAVPRLFCPARFQTFHTDWQFQGVHKPSKYSDSRVMQMVSLFGEDVVYVADPETIVEISANPTRYPKAVELYGTLCLDLPTLHI